LRSRRATGLLAGIEPMYVGERCSIVTWRADRARAGTRVTAVAPLPITTIALFVASKSVGQCCGWMISPWKSRTPSKSGR